MVKPGASDKERELWRRWRALGMAEVSPPDAMTLAAYADRRLSESEAEQVESWLAADPAAWTEFVALREVAQAPTAHADAAIVARACGLVDEKDAFAPSGNVVPLRRTVPAWRNALAWSSVAASLVAASLVGFTMGSDAYLSLSGNQTAQSTSSIDAFDASSTIDTYFSGDSGI